jgi:four helix bundle protein
VNALLRVNTHRKLVTWNAGRELVAVVYQIAAKLPRDERFVAAMQLMRAAWSVPNNVAEGNARRGARERRRFFDIALGSLAEVDSIIATLDDVYGLDSELIDRVEELRRRITAGLFGMMRNGRP